MKMMPPDVISHENQLQHLSEPSIFILDVFRTADHAGQIFIPHRRPKVTYPYFPTKPYPLLHHVFGMICRLNFVLFVPPQSLLTKRPVWYVTTINHLPRALLSSPELSTQNLSVISYPDSSDPLYSHSHTKCSNT